jgi:UDPglucose 6-dehydrogenase
MEKLSVIGLGKLGACSAACFASKGFEVTGVDINKDFVDAINSSKSPVYEPGLQELIAASNGRLKATQNYEEAIRDSDMTFLIVPTPSRQDGHFSDRYLQDAFKHLSLALKKANKKYHIFVITSTVSPGTIDESIIPLIESVSGKKLNRGFGVSYNPEFIALGNVIKDFLNPDMVLIGESDKTVGDRIEAVYMQVCDNKPYVARMSLISAEVTKISLNSYITMKISFANTLANLCESIPNANIDDITKALGADKRISPYYLKGGLSFGGPCFPRDNRAFAAFAGKYGYKAMLAITTDSVNQMQTENLAKMVMKHVSAIKGSSVSILGLTYKPNTPVIEESSAVKLIEELLKKDMEVIVFDPLAMENARSLFGDNILYASSVKDCISYSQVCVITTQENDFRSINSSYINHDPTVIIDCWRILDKVKLGQKAKYVALGMYEKPA